MHEGPKFFRMNKDIYSCWLTCYAIDNWTSLVSIKKLNGLKWNFKNQKEIL